MCQDLSTRHDWSVIKLLSIGRSRWQEIRNALPVIYWVRRWSTENKDLDAASQTLLYNRGKITSATEAKLKKMAEIVTNFALVDNILPDLHNSPDHTPPYPIKLFQLRNLLSWTKQAQVQARNVIDFRMHVSIIWNFPSKTVTIWSHYHLSSNLKPSVLWCHVDPFVVLTIKFKNCLG